MNIRTYALPDGNTVEATESGRCAGPGEGGQHYGTTYLYYRINGGPWEASNHRARHRFEEWVALSNDLKDFLEGEPGHNQAESP